jgi:hypothetical protein
MQKKEYSMVCRRYQVVVRYRTRYHPVPRTSGMPDLYTVTEPTKRFADHGVLTGQKPSFQINKAAEFSVKFNTYR